MRRYTLFLNAGADYSAGCLSSSSGRYDTGLSTGSIFEVKPKFAQLHELMTAAGRDFSKLEITSMVDTRVVSAADIRTYRDLGVTGLYVVAPGPEPQSVLKVMQDFAKKVQDAVG